MAPGAVAEFLEPGLLNFDLVVVEAADSTPSDHALGAIVRGRQVVLVGSPSAEPGSILELCRARGMPERVLPVAYGRALSPSVPSMEGGSREPSHDRTLEEVIAKSLTRSGYDVDHEVGAEGLGVDLAVRDPDDPNRYVLGILTDGAGYHAAASARERDRLIGEVLEGRGWNLHRAWALGWCRDPDAAWRRLLQAIERATALDPSIGPPDLDPVEEASGTWAAQIRALFESAGAPSEPWTPASPTGSADESVPTAPDVPSLEGPPYLEADFQVRLDCAPDQAPATELLSVVARIVDTEGPIHADEVTRRLARVWGIDQIGSRTQEAARWALQQAERDGEIQREGRFVWSSRGVNFRPRSRREVRSDTLRKANMIPPLEIRLALGQIVEGHVGVRPSEASELLTRVLGFERLGEELKDAFARQIQKMIEADELHLRDGKLYVA
ncbi:MAG: DUF3320 domain-containing protein [Gemmatimonadetes bacterium]|nr:DUF3320 domain-containing protein [Gemmatimonadota bacterium]